MTAPLVRLSGIERRFGSVLALDGADLEIRAGEVHGLLGANGAGKSTLLNVLGGMLRPDDGRIEVGGIPVALSSPRDAWSHGIALVHQHFTLVPPLTALENLSLGVRRLPSGASVEDSVVAVMERTGLRVPLGARVEELGVGDRQRIEILKALLRDPEVLVLDEPTAVLTPAEIDGLFGLLRDLAEGGRAVVLVAHKLDEVLGVAHRVTVLRDGRSVLSTIPDEHVVDDFVRAMVGADDADPIALGLGVESRVGSSEPGDIAVRVTAAHLTEAEGPRLRGVDLEIRRGEIVGIAGVEGNGQRELALLVAGRIVPDSGSVSLPQGIGFIPQDRSREGLIADFDVTENVALALHREPEYADGPWLRWEAMREGAEAIRTKYEVAAPSVGTRAGALSGGNQQRVVVGRELAMASDLLVAENPTRGLDVSAASFVHEELLELAERGVAIALVSTDLDEVLALSDRVFAIARGRLVEVTGDRLTREGVGALMLGGEEGSG